MKECHSSDLILDDAHVVVGGLRVELRLSLQVELQSLHVEPKVPGVRVALRRVAEAGGQTGQVGDAADTQLLTGGRASADL